MPPSTATTRSQHSVPSEGGHEPVVQRGSLRLRDSGARIDDARRSLSARVGLDDVKQKQNDHDDNDSDDAATYVHDCLLNARAG
jgi:hypothetical protein